MKARFFPLVLLMCSMAVVAQADDPVVMTINSQNFYKSEFEYFYNKYNSENVIDKRVLDEYLDLYKNLKLKVMEAEAKGLHETASFQAEFSGYRSAEAKPYLEDLETNEELLRKQYDRLKEMVEVSHIMILFPGVKNNDFKAFPSDTLETYNRAVQVRNRVLRGADFERAVAEYSDDYNPEQQGQPGYLGWFTGMMFPLLFEDVAFNTPIGAVGELARTDYGYHIVKIHAKKENPGQINAAHILILCPPEADKAQEDEALIKINEIYGRLNQGADFAALASEHSQDPGSASNGGDLGWFGLGVMVKEFQDAAFGLNEIGEISKPFKTQFGYHIVKLSGKKPVEPFEEMREEIENRLRSGGYFIPLHQQAIENMKKEFGFQKEDAGYQMLFSKANTIYPTDSLFFASFETQEFSLFTVGKVQYNTTQFIDFLRSNSRSPYTLSTELLNDRLQWFEYNALIEAKDQSLESNYPEFRNLIQEYRDGILMFEISNMEVWKRASEDTIGLSAYFNRNKQNYTWDEPHYKGYVVFAKDASTKRRMQRDIGRIRNPDAAAQFLLENYIVGDVAQIHVERGLFKRGDNAFVDREAFRSGTSVEFPEGFQDFFLIGNILRAPESYLDIRGLVITDYQDYLEEAWIKDLNERYQVTVYPDVIHTIK
jgi:peptidyl-prolyl cis-trans isomerase SurA